MRRWPSVIIASAVTIGAMMFILSAAFARDLGQWEASDPQISEWYRNLKQPDNPSVGALPPTTGSIDCCYRMFPRQQHPSVAALGPVAAMRAIILAIIPDLTY